MGYVRYQTYQTGTYIIRELQQSGAMAYLIEDGGDIIQLERHNGHQVRIHLIESGLPLYEIRNTLEYNARQNAYTLFILWARMMLPPHAKTYDPEDWMEALFTLYDGTIYGYDVFREDVYVFPVRFRGDSKRRYIEHGTTAHFARLRTRLLATELPNLTGTWRVADLNGYQEAVGDRKTRTDLTAEDFENLHEAYILLGVTPVDDLDTVKRAYRLLARRYHPDTNISESANAMMQEINLAYKYIVDSFDD